MHKHRISLLVALFITCLPGGIALGAPADRFEMRVLPERPPQKPTREQIFANCMQTPACREAMEQGARQDDPRPPRPAAQEPSPEEKSLQQMRPEAGGSPHAQIDWIGGLEALLAMLNPIPSAHAATYTISPSYYASEPRYSFTLTPSEPTFAKLYSYLVIYGARVYGESPLLYGSRTYSPSPVSEERPYVYFRVYAPESGEYVVNIQGTRGQAKLRHQYSGPIVAQWNYSSSTSYDANYTSVLRLEAGYHYFYFWPTNSSYFYVYSVSFESRF